MSLSEENKKRLAKLEKAELKDGEREEAELVNQFSVRDRLMRRLKSNTVKIPFKDDAGEFSIEVRLLSPDEQRQVAKHRRELLILRREINQKPTEIEAIKELGVRSENVLSAVYRLVAEICVDKSLNYKYWQAGKGFNTDTPFLLLNNASMLSQQSESETARFRRE